MKVGSYKSNLLEMFSEKLKIDDGGSDNSTVKGNTVGTNTPVFSRNGEMESTKLAFEEFLKQKKEMAIKQEKSLTQKDRMFLKMNDKDSVNKTVLNSVTNTVLLKGDKSSEAESRLRRNLLKPYANRHSRCTGTEEDNADGMCLGHGTEPCDHVEQKKCDCTYCAVFGTVHKNAELRDRLRVRLHQRREKRSKDVNKQPPPVNPNNLKPKNVAANRVETRVPLPSSPTNIPSAPSISSNESLGIGVEIPPNNDIHGILNYIEGNTGLNKQELAEKKAAKKARQRAKKEQERVELEEEEKRKAEELLQKEEERKREIERKLLESKKLEAALKKKEKKRKQALKRLGGVEVIEETVPAVVRIKRTSDENVKPSLVITLKGCTPDQETLLCTLVDEAKPQSIIEELSNGKKKKNRSVSKSSEEALIVSKNIDITVAVDKSYGKKSLEIPMMEKPSAQKVKANQKDARKMSNNVDIDEINALGNLRLPPGITITKVDGPVTTRNYISSDPPKGTSVVGKSGVIVVDTEQLATKPTKASQPAQTVNAKTTKRSRNRKNKKRDLVSTQQQKNHNDSTNNNNNKSKMVTLKNPIFQHYQPNPNKQSDNNTDTCAPAAIFTSENGMVTIRSSRLQQSLENSSETQPQNKTSVPNVWKNTALLNPAEPWLANGTFTNPNSYFPELNSGSNSRDVSLENPVASAKDAQEILSGLPGIEITKLDKNCMPSEQTAVPVCEEAQVTLYPSLNGGEPGLDELQFDKDDWLYDSVFKPRDVLEDDMDPEELELEAFKRFCSQSVPPKQKEKVAHLNVADIFWKKETDVKFN